MSRKQSMFFFVICGICLFLSFYSSQPPTGYTLSPHFNTVGSCSECHSGGTFQGSLDLDIPPLVANQSHDLGITICYDPSGGIPMLGGFSLDVINFNTLDHYGTLSAGSNTAVQDGGTYVSHNGALAFPEGQQCITYDFVWTTPMDFNNDLPIGFFAASVLANNNGANSGDKVITDDFLPMLPLGLIRFDATLVDENQVTLDWQFANAIDAEKFIIERSVDGFTFIEIGQRLISSGSKQYSDYEFIDIIEFPRNIMYYRLQILYSDGKIEFSDIKSTYQHVDYMPIRISPNPVKFGQSIKTELKEPLSGPAGLSFQIFTQKGKIMQHGNLKGGGAELFLDPELVPGLYFILFLNGTETISSEVLIIQ